jgi:m7GpppX diphosphatase
LTSSSQTHINYEGFPGITVGQAHLLDDIIDHLELESRLAVPPTTSYYEARTLTYALGTEHALYKGLAGVVAE